MSKYLWQLEEEKRNAEFRRKLEREDRREKLMAVAAIIWYLVLLVGFIWLLGLGFHKLADILRANGVKGL